MLVGLSLDEARRRAAAKGFGVRVAREDGVGHVLSCDFRACRINVVLESGRVVAVAAVG